MLSDGCSECVNLSTLGTTVLRFLPGPLPCLHNIYHYKIPEQGKGTDDHLLPLGDWLDHNPCSFAQKKDQMLSRLSDVLKTRLRENVVKVVHRPDSKKLTDGSIE